MGEEYHVREYQQGDEKGIVKLLESSFDSWPRFDLKNTKIDYWNWLYRDNPLNKYNTNVVAISRNGEIVGCNHGTTLYLIINGQRVLGQIAGGLAVHIDHRRKGIYGKFRPVKREIHDRNGIDMTYQFTTNPIVIEGSLKRGRPVFPGQILRMIKIFDLDLHSKMNEKTAWWKRYGYKTRIEFEKILSSGRTHPIQIQENYVLTEIKKFDPRINVFWKKIRDHYDFIIERTMDYLNWRYCDENGGSYFVIQVEDNEIVVGYAVLRVNKLRDGYPIGTVVDLLSLPGHVEVSRILINYAVSYFNEKAVNIVHGWTLTAHPYEKTYLENGFIRRKEMFHVALNSISSSSVEQINAIKNVQPERLHLQYGDSDLI